MMISKRKIDGLRMIINILSLNMTEQSVFAIIFHRFNFESLEIRCNRYFIISQLVSDNR